MWEITFIFGKWLKYLRNGQITWEMTDLEIWEMAKIFGKWLRSI